MSFSIDGKEYTANHIVKYGEEFPKRFSNRKVHLDDFGDCNIYYTGVGTPKWSNNMTVKVPTSFYITEIIDPNKEYLKSEKKKKLGLRLIES